MAAVFAFTGMLLLSMVVALLAALQLGDFFSTDAEIVPVIAAVACFAVIVMAILATAYPLVRSAGVLNGIACVLALLAFAPAFLPGPVQTLIGRFGNPYTISTERIAATVELIVPALAAVLVQWGLVRRRWLRTTGGDEFSVWPWITTGIAGLVILNPYGLEFLRDTLRHSKSDFMWPLTASITAGVLGGLLVMVWIECYIRERMLHRRRPTGDRTPG